MWASSKFDPFSPWELSDYSELYRYYNLYTIIGTGVKTLTGYDVTFPTKGQKYIEMGAFPHQGVILKPRYGDGDGTVPLWSAELPVSVTKYYISHSSSNSAEHGRLPDNNEVQKIVGEILKARTEGEQPSITVSSYTKSSSLAEVDSTDFTIPKTWPRERYVPPVLDFSDPDFYNSIPSGFYKTNWGSINKYEITSPTTSTSPTPTKPTEPTKPTPDTPAQFAPIVPKWIKNNAEWWADDLIKDSDFTEGIQYLIKEKIIDIQDMPEPSTEAAEQKIPDWIKNNAGWWAQGQISENDFLNGIKYLVEKGIIQVN